MIALHFFERKGTEADVAQRQPAAVRQRPPVKGKNWDPGMTVGKVAKQALDGLRERLGQPKVRGTERLSAGPDREAA